MASFLLFSLVLTAFCAIEEIKIWPYPTTFSDTANGTGIVVDDYVFKLYDIKTKKYFPVEEDDFFKSLVERYKPFLLNKFEVPNFQIQKCQNKKFISMASMTIEMHVGDINEREYTLKTLENYTLSISASQGVLITGPTIFSILRGMDSFSQLVSNREIHNLPIAISDCPRYPWRGLLLDVSRHYLSLSTIKKVIDGMSFNKLNVLHIHLVDAQSFPLVIPEYPLLSQKGSYAKSAIYTQADMKEIVQYGFLRGVRIVPELDVPGHSYSFGHGYPNVMADCPSRVKNINSFALNPLSEDAKKIVKSVIGDFTQIFPEKHVHLGGDEIDFGCWLEDPSISKYLKEHHMEPKELEAIFAQDILAFTSSLSKTSVSWQERAEEHFQMPKDSIVQVWKNLGDLTKLSSDGYKILNSAGWYIDRLIPVPPLVHYLLLDTYIDMWEVEIDDYVPEKHRNEVLGGEGCQWGEQINDDVALQRIFPKASAFAERLWSPKRVKINRVKEVRNDADVEVLEKRIMFHICHNLLQRGIPSSPIRPDYCPTKPL